MKGTRFVDGVLVSQEQLNNAENKQGASLKERAGSLVDYGIVEDGTNPLTLTNNANITVDISSGEAFCDFNRNNISPEHGNTGERIYVTQALTALPIKNGPIASPDRRHLLLTYVEMHSDRKLDESNNAHYTAKEDGYIVAQLTDSELADLNTNKTVYVSSNPLHTLQTVMYSLTTDEMNDTFGTGKWSESSGVRYAGVTVTSYNSIYLGTIQEGGILTNYSVSSRPAYKINERVLQLPDIEQLAQETHRKVQHSNGVFGGIDALKCVVDATIVPDELKISNLATGEYGYVNGHRFTTGELLSTYTTIQATNAAYFPYADTDYFVYAFYDISDGDIKTAAIRVTDVDTITGIENYTLLCRIYINSAKDSIYAYEGDKRYNTGSAINPVIDLRNFGTLYTNRISDEARNELSSGNLLTAGNFEQGENEEVPLGWNGSYITLDNSNNLGGKFSLKVLASGIAISDPIPYSKLSAYSVEASLKSSSTSVIALGLRGYVGKDYLDVSANNDATDPINVSYTTPVSAGALTTSWEVQKGGFNRVRLSDEWTGTTGNSGSYSYPTDIDLIKYVRVVVKYISGDTFYVGNVKLYENKDYHHDDLIIDGDLIVNGTTTTVNTATLDIEDVNITLNKGGVSADGSGITVEQTGTDGSLVYEGSLASNWKLGDVGAEAEVVTVSDTQTITNKRHNLPKINSATTTNVTSEELETLSNGSDADSLHIHPTLAANYLATGYLATNVTVTSSWTKLSMVDEYDPYSMITGGNFYPTTSGYYLICGDVRFDNFNEYSTPSVGIAVNGSIKFQAYYRAAREPQHYGYNYTSVAFSKIIYITNGDYITLYGYIPNLIAGTMTAGNAYTYMSVALL